MRKAFYGFQIKESEEYDLQEVLRLGKGGAWSEVSSKNGIFGET